MPTVSATFDASVFSLPDLNDSQVDVEEHIASLLDKINELDEHKLWIKVYKSKQSVLDLFADEFYERLEAMLSSVGVYDFPTVYSRLLGWLDKLPDFEDQFGISNVELGHFSSSLDLLPPGSENPHVCERSKQCIVIHSILQQCCGVENHPVILQSTPSNKIEVQANGVNSF